jgi:OOP family OmpA-OmpF porin
VKTYLGAAGIDAARLTTAGFGSSQPVGPNTTENGRAQNRRVELAKE